MTTPAAVDEPRVSPEFQLEIIASVDDIDELGHVSNVSYVRFLQQVAVAHSRTVGWDFDRYQRAGVVFVVRRHEVDYLAPAFAGEALVLTTFIASWSGATSERRTLCRRAGDGREIVRARTRWALIAIESGRPVRISPELRAAFAREL